MCASIASGVTSLDASRFVILHGSSVAPDSEVSDSIILRGLLGIIRRPLSDRPTCGDAASIDMTAIVWVMVIVCIYLFFLCLIYMRGHE